MDSVRADFAVADDLLQEAARSRLASYGQILVEKSGRIGPLVELELASTQFQEQYGEVSTNSTFSTSLRRSLQTGQPFGSAYNDSAGAFPLTADNPVTAAGDMWDQWSIHAENIAKRKGLNPHVVASLLGAMVELQDNVYEHSGAPQTGLVAFATTQSSFEFVVADRGIGVLRTLRQNARYADLSNAGAALQEIIKDGVSRFPSETGRGKGFNQLFRALVGQNAELRFRSGDHALTLQPTNDALHGETVLAHIAPLDGLSVSVLYRTTEA